MKVTIQCLGSFLIELQRALRAVCTKEFVHISFQDDFLIIQDNLIGPTSWVQVDISSQTFFKKYEIKSKAPKNRIVLKAIYSVLLEALQACSAFNGSRIVIRLANNAPQRLWLEFKCEVPEDDEAFSFEKEVDVVIEPAADSINPEIPKAIECELVCMHHLQQMILPASGETSLMEICLSVEDCHVCQPKDKRDLDYVFDCRHNRKAFKIPESGKFTVRSKETTPLQVICGYKNLPLKPGQCLLYNTITLVRAKDLMMVFQKASSLTWNKSVLGVQHENEVIVTTSWKESLTVNFLIAAHLED